MYIAFCSAKWIILRHDNTCTLWRMQMISDQYQSMFSGKGKYILDVSGIIEKFNVYATLAIIPRTKEINKAFWLVHKFIKTLNFKLLGRRISLLHDFCQKNLALLLFHNYSGNVYCWRFIFDLVVKYGWLIFNYQTQSPSCSLWGNRKDKLLVLL